VETAGRLTALRAGFPCSTSAICSATSTATLICDSSVEAPRCGVTRTCRSDNRGLFGSGGSLANTSSAAPATWPLRNASHHARPRHSPTLARLPRRGLVPNPAPRTVDDANPRLHLRQLRRPDHPPRLLVQRKMNRHKVAALQQVFERDFLYADPPDALRGG